MGMTTSQNTLYQKALRYAMKCNPAVYRDIVHDAYVTWFNKTNSNLFDQPEGTVIKVVKYTHLKQTERNKYMSGGKWYPRVFQEFEEYMRYNKITPEDEYIASELEMHMIEFSAKQKLDVFLYAVQGLDQVTVAAMTGLSTALVNYYFKRMRYNATIFN
jgi:DNA-directed RNA polymerase specialized sigma24 family protein